MAKLLILGLLLLAAFPSAQSPQKFTGTITDDMCPAGDHSRMRMGSTDAECTIACIEAHGALYVLFDGKNAYTLSDQENPRKFAGTKVAVTGTLDVKNRTIHVTSIVPIRELR